jgi:hypothetical protein
MQKLVGLILIVTVFSAFSGCLSSNSSNTILPQSDSSQSNQTPTENTAMNSNIPSGSFVRCIDSTRHIQIDYPSDYTAGIESMNGYHYLVIRSPLHMIDSDNPRQDIRDAWFSNMEYWCTYSEGTTFCRWYNSSEIKISDTVIYISGFTSSGYDASNSPGEAQTYYKDYTNKSQPNLKMNFANITINGIQTTQITYEIPGQPYWTVLELHLEGKTLAVSYGEYKKSRFDDRSETVRKIIDSITYIEDPASTPIEPGIASVTPIPTINQSIHYETEKEETYTLNPGDIRAYENTYNKVAIFEMDSDAPVSLTKGINGKLTVIGLDITHYNASFSYKSYLENYDKTFTTDYTYAVINNKVYPINVSVRIKTAKCDPGPSDFCLRYLQAG